MLATLAMTVIASCNMQYGHVDKQADQMIVMYRLMVEWRCVPSESGVSPEAKAAPSCAVSGMLALGSYVAKKAARPTAAGKGDEYIATTSTASRASARRAAVVYSAQNTSRHDLDPLVHCLHTRPRSSGKGDVEVNV